VLQFHVTLLRLVLGVSKIFTQYCFFCCKSLLLCLDFWRGCVGTPVYF
jgi:hypothetical protein